jgi:hypothetical protein
VYDSELRGVPKDAHSMTVRASPIQTITVGTGISPVQPFASGFQ